MSSKKRAELIDLASQINPTTTPIMVQLLVKQGVRLPEAWRIYSKITKETMALEEQYYDYLSMMKKI